MYKGTREDPSSLSSTPFPFTPPLPLLPEQFHLPWAMFHFLLVSCLLPVSCTYSQDHIFPFGNEPLYLTSSTPPLASRKCDHSWLFLYNPEMSFCSNLLNRKSNYFSLSLFLMRKDWFPGTRSLERLLLQDNKKISFDSVFDLFPSPHYHFSIFPPQLITKWQYFNWCYSHLRKSETESGLFSRAPTFCV